MAASITKAVCKADVVMFAASVKMGSKPTSDANQHLLSFDLLWRHKRPIAALRPIFKMRRSQTAYRTLAA